MADGHEIVVVTLEVNAPWNEAEIKWIAHLRGCGADLVNATSGGDGALGVKWTDERRRNLSNAMKGKEKSAAHREALAKARKGVPLPKGVAEKVSLALKGRTPKNLLDIQAGNKGMVRPQELRDRISASLKGRQVTSRDQLLKNLGYEDGMANR